MTTETVAAVGGVVAVEGQQQTATANTPVLIRCMCCSVPVAERRGDVLIIKSRHHGREHVTVIPLSSPSYVVP